MKRNNYEEMVLETLVESQRKDDRPEQWPERYSTFPLADPSVLDGYIDSDAEGPIAVARTKAEQRPSINGIPGVYDDITPWTWKIRYGGYIDPRAKGCRTHGMEYWRVNNMQTDEPLKRAYCSECKKARRQ